MPPAKKEKPTNQGKKEQAPSFEQALEELEAMVETMESGELPLEKLIASYERGAKLVGHCESVLSDARKRLELITLKPKFTQGDGGQDADENFAQEQAQQGTSPSDDTNDDDIRLF
jgi:exodeoxyribonuclease VII small subunit